MLFWLPFKQLETGDITYSQQLLYHAALKQNHNSGLQVLLHKCINFQLHVIDECLVFERFWVRIYLNKTHLFKIQQYIDIKYPRRPLDSPKHANFISSNQVEPLCTYKKSSKVIKSENLIQVKSSVWGVEVAQWSTNNSSI